ncbi:hypothetical protein [Streptomyces daliensis]
MNSDLSIHASQSLVAPGGELVDIDVEMVPVIQSLWQMGYGTTACCQDVGEATAALRAARKAPSRYGGDGFIAFHRGYALLKMPVPDARRLITLLLTTETFHQRVRTPWRAGSWRKNVPLLCDESSVDLSPNALLHFPRNQISELAKFLAETAGPRGHRPVR